MKALIFRLLLQSVIVVISVWWTEQLSLLAEKLVVSRCNGRLLKALTLFTFVLYFPCLVK